MKKILVTRVGLQLLEKQRLTLMDRLKFVQSQKGEAAEVGGDGWHDNFAFEDLVRQENMLNRQILDATQLVKNAEVVPNTPPDTKTLQVGHVITLYIEDDDETKEVIVSGFGESNLHITPQVIDYNAPLIYPFFGHEEGYEADIRLGSVEKHVVLETIRQRRD